jgi:hypothetical protein
MGLPRALRLGGADPLIEGADDTCARPPSGSPRKTEKPSPRPRALPVSSSVYFSVPLLELLGAVRPLRPARAHDRISITPVDANLPARQQRRGGTPAAPPLPCGQLFLKPGLELIYSLALSLDALSSSFKQVNCS